MKLSEIIKEMEKEYDVAKHNKYWQKIEIIEYYLPLLKALNDEDWVSVGSGVFPKENERVIVYYENESKKKWREFAFYTYGGVQEFDDDNDDFPECFNEEKGVSYLSKGFWLNSEVDECLFHRLSVTHWRYPPTPPNIENKNSKA